MSDGGLEQEQDVPLLRLSGISKSFGPARALDNVDLTVRAHEVLGLIGENGAGKSTLLRILAGIHQPDSGRVEVGGTARRIDSPAQAAHLGIGVVHQEQSLITNLTIGENLLLGSGLGGVRFGVYNWRRVNKQARRVLERVGSTADPSTKVDALTFPERQMIEIAKAVSVIDSSSHLPVIVLDEPTSVLEKEDVALLRSEVERLREIGSVLFVSHRLDEVIDFCDRVYVMRHGKVVGERDTSNVSENELFELMTGRESSKKPRASVESGEVALRVEGLGRRGCFHDVSLTVRKGEVHTLLGVKDSGREELCRSLFGAEPFDQGAISLDGEPLRSLSIRGALRRGIGYIPSERKLEGMIPGMSVAENLTLTHPGPSSAGPFIRPFRRTADVKEWVGRLDIRPPVPGMDIERLSGGNQQKVVVAKWLRDPALRLLILDHPTRGVDPGAREVVYEAIAEACSRGVAVLLLADTLEEALEVSHTITTMRDGVVSARYDLRTEVPTMAQLIERMV